MPACALAAMAAMTRIPGLALFPALGLEYLRQNEWRIGRARKAIGLHRHPVDRSGRDRVVLRMALRRSAGVPARPAGRMEPSGGVAGYVRDFNYFFEAPIFPCSGMADCVKEFAPTRTLLGVIYLALLPASIVLTHRGGAHARRRTDGVGAHLDRDVAAERLRRRRPVYGGAVSGVHLAGDAAAEPRCVRDGVRGERCRSCCCSSLSSRAGARCCRRDACRQGSDRTSPRPTSPAGTAPPCPGSRTRT